MCDCEKTCPPGWDCGCACHKKDVRCDICGALLVERHYTQRDGTPRSFLGCSAYPRCPGPPPPWESERDGDDRLADELDYMDLNEDIPF